MADTETGTFVWYELMASDAKAAIAFYREVIGWKTQPFAQGDAYVMWVGSQAARTFEAGICATCVAAVKSGGREGGRRDVALGGGQGHEPFSVWRPTAACRGVELCAAARAQRGFGCGRVKRPWELGSAERQRELPWEHRSWPRRRPWEPSPAWASTRATACALVATSTNATAPDIWNTAIHLWRTHAA
jgi:catechol 2,3-dioxygenase-like lactoylglutathione lyase family enzyme